MTLADRRPLTTKDLKARLELCRDFGVAQYEETPDGGFKFLLGPRVVTMPAPEPLTAEEARARKEAEFRRVATMHNRGGR